MIWPTKWQWTNLCQVIAQMQIRSVQTFSTAKMEKTVRLWVCVRQMILVLYSRNVIRKQENAINKKFVRVKTNIKMIIRLNK